ncbi:MAG: nucleotidyltransferase family protein [Halioglobus sp.]|nr:nucleotidyltransferase family protein [Halioglobus sp.]
MGGAAVKAMVLAAGVGERMRPLTDRTPKPLLSVAGVPLIEYHLRALSRAGVRDVVINVSHLAGQIIDFCGDGSRWDLAIAYSREEQPLETAGGILQALPLLGEAPFLVVNGDVWTDFPLEQLLPGTLREGEAAHLVMVDSPPQHPLGDFVLDGEGWLHRRGEGERGYTYAGIGIYCAAFLEGLAPGKTPLRPLLDRAIDAGTLGARHSAGRWEDVGTPERLLALDEAVCSGR